MSDEERDRGFGPAVQAAVEWAAERNKWEANANAPGHSTDPNWRPHLWPSSTAGTITPPHAEPLSPHHRAQLEQLERIVSEVETALAYLRAILRRP